MDLSKIQHLLSASRLDGWLFTDFHGHDLYCSFCNPRHCKKKKKKKRKRN